MTESCGKISMSMLTDAVRKLPVEEQVKQARVRSLVSVSVRGEMHAAQAEAGVCLYPRSARPGGPSG